MRTPNGGASACSLVTTVLRVAPSSRPLQSQESQRPSVSWRELWGASEGSLWRLQGKIRISGPWLRRGYGTKGLSKSHDINCLECLNDESADAALETPRLAAAIDHRARSISMPTLRTWGSTSGFSILTFTASTRGSERHSAAIRSASVSIRCTCSAWTSCTVPSTTAA